MLYVRDLPDFQVTTGFFTIQGVEIVQHLFQQLPALGTRHDAPGPAPKQGAETDVTGDEVRKVLLLRPVGQRRRPPAAARKGGKEEVGNDGSQEPAVDALLVRHKVPEAIVEPAVDAGTKFRQGHGVPETDQKKSMISLIVC